MVIRWHIRGIKTTVVGPVGLALAPNQRQADQSSPGDKKRGRFGNIGGRRRGRRRCSHLIGNRSRGVVGKRNRTRPTRHGNREIRNGVRRAVHGDEQTGVVASAGVAYVRGRATKSACSEVPRRRRSVRVYDHADQEGSAEFAKRTRYGAAGRPLPDYRAHALPGELLAAEQP